MSSDADRDAVAAQLTRRREAVAHAWGLDKEIVLVGAGEPVPVPGRGDRTYPFRSHSEYLYLTDRERPGGVLAFDPAVGWVDFVAPVTTQEILWSGAAPDADGVSVEGLDEWLAARAGRPVARLGASHDGIASDAVLEDELRDRLSEVRRRKDPAELERMRVAARATAAGFAAMRELIDPGRSERELQIELEAAFFRAGGDALAFDTIIAGGPNAAVLHSMPSARPLGDGELVLVDAGAEYRGYASDVTRTYPVSGRFTAEQRELHALVTRANRAAIERCAAGVDFSDVHEAAALEIAGGLADFGILRGDPDSLVDSGAVGLFFPHGIGHPVGLGIRDTGAPVRRQPTRKRSTRSLRVDLTLHAGIVVTIEPGVYFVRALLQDAEVRARHSGAVDWDRVDALLDFGGVRVEDDVLITDAGREVLTADVPLV
jgi:Xaa-Pro aminopeptidase